MINLRHILPTLTFLAFACPALAHAPSIGPHGGPRVDAGSYHVEMVIKGRDVDIHVTDANYKPVPVEGYSGTAILIVEGKVARIALQPKGNSILSGTASQELAGKVKGAVQIKPASGSMVQGKFD